MMRNAAWLAGAIALAFGGVEAFAQERPPVRQDPIEIRGTVPTPQVVTVRPREVPAYSRRVLVPTFYDHDFWPSILPGYDVVSERTLTGRVPPDTTLRGDTLGGVPLRRQDAPEMRVDTLGRPLVPPVPPDTGVRPDTAIRMQQQRPVTPPAPPQATSARSSLAPPGMTGSADAPGSGLRRAPQVGTAPAPSTRQ